MAILQNRMSARTAAEDGEPASLSTAGGRISAGRLAADASARLFSSGRPRPHRPPSPQAVPGYYRACSALARGFFFLGVRTAVKVLVFGPPFNTIFGMNGRKASCGSGSFPLWRHIQVTIDMGSLVPLEPARGIGSRWLGKFAHCGLLPVISALQPSAIAGSAGGDGGLVDEAVPVGSECRKKDQLKEHTAQNEGLLFGDRRVGRVTYSFLLHLHAGRL